MKKIIFFHRNKKCGFSINKVTQNVIKAFNDKEEFYVPYYNASLLSILKNIIYVFCRRQKTAINHVTGDIHYCILGLIGCYSVLTIHDVVGLDYHKHSFVKRKIIEWLWYRLPIKFATKVVCISNETRKAIYRFTNRTDIAVVHNAFDSSMKYLPKILDLKFPRILCIGTSENKNLLRTFKALQGVPCTIVIVGKMNDSQIKCLKDTSAIYENKINLTDEEIIEEYKKCDIVSFTSLYEGFGMPVIEANAIGRPVICSNIPVLKEIAADAAEYVDPYCIGNIRRAFFKLISNLSESQNLIEKGLINALRYQQNEICFQWEKIYQEIL